MEIWVRGLYQILPACLLECTSASHAHISLSQLILSSDHQAAYLSSLSSKESAHPHTHRHTDVHTYTRTDIHTHTNARTHAGARTQSPHGPNNVKQRKLKATTPNSQNPNCRPKPKAAKALRPRVWGLGFWHGFGLERIPERLMG